MSARARQALMTFAIVLVVELVVRAALNAYQLGRFEALLTTSDIIQALLVAVTLAVFFGGQRGGRR